jgi:8-oxo-dGTP pyrophosphatase MutT (NUDIX family)
MWKEELQGHWWEEGKVIKLDPSSYRHRIVVVCYKFGRQKAEFSNGEGNFGAYVELVRGDGSWISYGNNVVPVLQDGRLVMVVEQRPAQYGWENKPGKLIINGKEMDLGQFGPYSSLEFPGGAVEKDESLKVAALRELTEETGVKLEGEMYFRNPPFHAQGADLSIRANQAVVFLKGLSYPERVDNDGGLSVLALTPSEVQAAIWSGAVDSAQAGLVGWGFYKEVIAAVSDPGMLQNMIGSGYVTVSAVELAR